jgi:hypothetical protein
MIHPMKAFVFLSGALALSACSEPNAPAPATPEAPVATATPGDAAPAAPAAVPATATAQPQGPLSPAHACNLETINGTLFDSAPVSIASPAVLKGWLGNDAGGTLASPELVVEVGADSAPRAYPLSLVIERKDVVAAFPALALPANTGFEVTVDPQGLPAGTHRAYLRYRVGDRSFACDNGRQLKTGG